jgi:nuclear pore complex protein Nup155
VVIFKAQEQVKRGSEAGSTDAGRQLLNESHRLFKKVASSLSYEHLKWAVERYVEMSFYAGAISLCLDVAAEKDKSRRAHAWLRDDKPERDPRKEDYDTREACYKLIFMTILHLDQSTANSPDTVDGRHTLTGKRRSEAYDIINSSDDVVFLTCLYNWYVEELGQPDRLLEINNPFVVEYLRKRSQDSRGHADLLWRYFAHQNDYLQSASIQLDIARSHFDISLEERIGYLSRARTNASTRQTALTDARQSKQKLLREVSDLLDIASVQDEILSRLRADPRHKGEAPSVFLRELNSQILSVEILFNRYADYCGYHDLCIMLYMVADHRNPADIQASWQQLINVTDQESPAVLGRQRAPWEAVGEKVREMGRRLQTAPSTFPVQLLLPVLEKYAHDCPRDNRPGESWAVDLFLDLEIPHETLLPILEMIYFGNEHPFQGAKRRQIAGKMVYLIDRWLEASERNGDRVLFGNEESLSVATDCLATLIRSDHLDEHRRQQADSLHARIVYAQR